MQKKLTEVYLDLEDKMSKLGMEISEKKTKYIGTSTYEHRRNAGDLRIGNKTFEVVQSFRYLGNTISNINNNNKCIKKRIMMGNKAYYANRQLFNSSLVSRNSKLQIYRTLVRPVATCVSVSWTLTMVGERALAVFERKILRKIYGPVKENELWRIRQNDALEVIIKREKIIIIRRLTSFESFGLLNDVFPFYTVLDTGCPIFYLKLADVLHYVVFPSLFGPSFGSYG
jgi:hypothetical protein